ncbi:MAG TPA: redoxin family protein [Candidatus Acidoferrum sp.]|nr:redoxin family protein [Candidatus Acidoferrum sp.]
MDRYLHALRVLRPTLVLITVAWLAPFGLASRSAENTAFDLAGNPVDPLKASGGKVVVLVFVRTDCPVSNRYAPTIQKLSAAHEGKALFWLVYPSKSESSEAIRKHDREYGYKIASLRDPQKALVKLSEAQITPETAVFDGKGHLVYHGRIDNLYEEFGRARTVATTHELEDAIEAALSGKSLPASSTHAVGCYISDLE